MDISFRGRDTDSLSSDRHLVCRDGSGRGHFELSIDEQKLTCTVKDTGGDGCWREFEMGQLTILSAGVHRLEVRGLSLVSDSLMNLRKVTLLPVKRSEDS